MQCGTVGRRVYHGLAAAEIRKIGRDASHWVNLDKGFPKLNYCVC